MTEALKQKGAPGTAREVAVAFLKLGLSSFGGPVAHIGYFRTAFVARRAWLDDKAFADLVALAQFLPGPASSQTAFGLGLMRAGWKGALAAWVAFTTPSALLMILFATLLQSDAQALNGPFAVAVVHGLKLVAVPVVAQAVWSMARTLCPDPQRILIAVACAALMFAVPGAAAQIASITLGAIIGLVVCCSDADSARDAPSPAPPRASLFCLGLFAALLVALPLTHNLAAPFALADAMYRAGALVFGGGHVVLPLLREAVVTPGWLSDQTFLAGYGAAQAVPGPLFTFAAFIGALAKPGGVPLGIAGALLALVMIFLPGMLLLGGALPFWHRFRAAPSAQAAVRGVNAAVVGVLAAAFYSPVAVTAVTSWPDAAIAAAGLALLIWRRPPWMVVVLVVLASIGAALV